MLSANYADDGPLAWSVLVSLAWFVSGHCSSVGKWLC